MRALGYALLLLAGPALVLALSYGAVLEAMILPAVRGQQLTERDRFLLGMKAASHPENLTTDERETLRIVRSPSWSIWRWMPDLWRRRPLGRRRTLRASTGNRIRSSFPFDISPPQA